MPDLSQVSHFHNPRKLELLVVAILRQSRLAQQKHRRIFYRISILPRLRFGSHDHVPAGLDLEQITREIIESYLNCNYKGHLKLAGQRGTLSDYEALATAASASSREQALTRLAARFGEGTAGQGAVTAALLEQGTPFLLDACLEGDGLSLRLDGLKRVDGASKLGDHHYLPVLHVLGDKVGRREKTLLALAGLAVAGVQGLRPAVGLVSRGPDARLGKVRLNPKLYRQAEQVLDEVNRLQAGASRRG